MGQGRTLERAKDNRKLSALARTSRKHTCRTGREEKPQTEVRSPTIRRKGAAPTTSGGRAQPTADPYGDFIPKGRDNMKKQPKGKGDIGGATTNPKGSDGTQHMGRCLSTRATARKRRIPSAKTPRERGNNANRIDKRDRRK